VATTHRREARKARAERAKQAKPPKPPKRAKRAKRPKRAKKAKAAASQKPVSRTGWVRPFTDRPLSVFRFARSRDDVLISGVAGGIGERIGVDPVVVRVAFVALSAAGAIGVIAYLVGWSLSLDPGDRRAPIRRPPTPAQDIAFGFVVLGTILLLRSVGLWFGDAVGFPVLIGALGAGVVYAGAGTGTTRRTRTLLGDVPATRPSFAHLIFGGLFVVGGVTWFFLTVNRSVSGLFAIMLAVAVTAVGLSIVFGPWVYRMTNQLGHERRERVRSEARTELAAHLHDSVLQTLALIQRNAANPRKMANLARRQERELRAWLYGSQDMDVGRFETFQQLLEEIEDAYDVTIDTVMVGTAPLNERTEATALALLEAAKNAARHSGTTEISVYIECDDWNITAYVRDRGNGFDPDGIPDDRRGIADSIRGRVERHGGTVTITSARGDGCEVQITMPLAGAERRREVDGAGS
jgi:signal transduction histidine kinase/phage shock protein PspC (stress-responsive transcriptional regulator)